MGNPQLPNVTPPKMVRRFRTNPVEIAIFSVLTLIFFNSAYQLVYEQGGFQPTALTPMAANPVSTLPVAEGRSPASKTAAQSPLVSLDLRCDANPDLETTANKVRLSGALCTQSRAPASGDSEPALAKVTVTNFANQANATVFVDSEGGKFSTDYLSLNTGKNPIRVEFSYSGGSVVNQELNVVKN